MLYNVDFIFKINVLIYFMLIELLSTTVHAACPAYESIHEQKSCRTSSVEPARSDKFYQNSAVQDSFLLQLQQDSFQKVETLQKDPTFREILTELQNNSPQFQNGSVNSGSEAQGNLSETNLGEVGLYIFISFSMGEKALLNLAHEAKRFGAILVLRGFKDGSYLKTAASLQNIIIKTGQGVIIDSELYALFNITAVPTFVLVKSSNLNAVERVQTPIHDKLQGHVSAQYALDTFTKEGDLRHEAQRLLHKGVSS